MRALLHLTSLLLCCIPCAMGIAADDLALLAADRAAVERVYYNHRLGTKPPFEQVLPRATLEALVRKDLHKETVLKDVYGVEITSAMVEAEVRRIDATTRAPEILAELKAALGNDAARFARTVARPIVAERTLRARFENDDTLHVLARGKAERLRQELIAAKKAGAAAEELISLLHKSADASFQKTTWQLGPRGDSRAEPAAFDPLSAAAPQPFSTKTAGGIYSVEATVQFAQVLRSPERDPKFYFEDLPSELQHVFRVQLRAPGDISAVVEMSPGFLIYVLQSRTADSMTVTSSSIGKCDYETWLAGLRTEFNRPAPSTERADKP